MKNFFKGIVYYCKDGLFSVIILCEPIPKRVRNVRSQAWQFAIPQSACIAD